MTTPLTSDASREDSTNYAHRAMALHQLVETTDQVRLKRQVIRSSATAIGGLLGIIAVFLFMFCGPELGERAATFVGFLLIVFVSMFLVSVFALATPVLDVLTLHRLASLQKDLECYDLVQSNQRLAQILWEANAAEDPKLVLQSHQDSIRMLTAEAQKAFV